MFPFLPCKMRLFYECGPRENFSVNEVYVKKFQCCLAETMYKQEEDVQVKFCLCEIPFHQAQILLVMLCFSLYFTCIFYHLHEAKPLLG